MFTNGKPVPSSSSVDVTDANGLVRRGMICGKAINGLFVDFGYTGHNKDFVPFGQCTNHIEPDLNADEDVDYRIGDTVEALYQSAPDQPWHWYPAKFLAGSWRFAFVAISTGETAVEKVVPMDAVRRVHLLKLSGSDILKHYFEHSFRIPKSGDLGKLTSRLMEKFGEAGFLRIWNLETDTEGMKLEGGRLFYSCSMERSLPPDYIKKLLREIAETYLSCEALSSATVDPISMGSDQFDMMDDQISALLPLHIMHEIFSFLSPIQQVPCRKVCQLWNSFLTASASTYPVEIDITPLGYTNFTIDYHKLAAMLHKRVTESTKVLVLSGVNQSPFIEPLHTVKTMLTAMNRSIPLIILSGATVEARDLLDSWYSADCDSQLCHSKWRDVCDTLILHNVAVLLPLANTAVTVKKEVLDVQVAVGVENVLEKWCPEVSGPEMEVLEEKLRLFWGQNDNDDNQKRLYLWQLLSKYQPADERFPPYRSVRPIPAGTLGVPALASLRRLTVWVLSGYSRFRTDNRFKKDPFTDGSDEYWFDGFEYY